MPDARSPETAVRPSVRTNDVADGSITAQLPNASASAASGIAPLRGLRRLLYLTVAGFFFLLAAAGAVLPGLPATPFLLLTTFFLVRSSPSLNARLLRSRWFGPILTDWQLRGGVRRDIKIKAVITVAIAVGLTIWLSGRSLWPTVTILGLATIGITVVLRLPEAAGDLPKKYSRDSPKPGTQP